MADLNIPELIEVATKVLPAHITLKVRGKHGIGKTELCHQIGKILKRRVIICHMAQYSEADILGLPELSEGITKYRKPHFLHIASTEPVILVLDELNRARPETMQVTFPLILDRKLEANDTILHPETRIIALENEGNEYAVTMFDDRAHASRFWSCRLVPTIEDWLAWGKETNSEGLANIHPFIQSFFSYPDYQQHLEASPDMAFATNDVSPDRRAWKRLSDTLVSSNLMDLKLANTPIFYKLCDGFVGSAASIRFRDFLLNMAKKVTAVEILTNWEAAKVKMGFTQTEEDRNLFLEASMKVCEHLDQGNVLAQPQILELRKLMKDCPHELRFRLWQSISCKGETNPNLKNIHPHVKDIMVETATAGRGKLPTAEKTETT